MIFAARFFALAAIALGFIAPTTALGASCKELAYGSPMYEEKMRELASQAKLPGDAWTRYHESVVVGLCSGKTRDVDDAVGSGSVPVDEAQRIATILGKPYRPKQPTETRKKYASSKAEFIDMGACVACADNIAQHYAKRPKSQCAKLAKRAIDGDSRAIDELVDFPDFCRWAYRGSRR